MLLSTERLLFVWERRSGTATGSGGARVGVTGRKDAGAAVRLDATATVTLRGVKLTGSVVRFDATVVASLRGVKAASSVVRGSVGAQGAASGYALYFPTVTGDVLSVVIGGRVVA